MGSLPIKLKPRQDEVFSSWVSRLALAHGLSGNKFLPLLFPNIKHKYYSPDRILDPEVYKQISIHTGVSPQEIKKTSVIYYAEKFTHEISSSGPLPWILPFVNNKNQSPFIYGIQFCPKCLDENCYFRLSHRLAFIVVCPIHRLQLLDRCQHCYRPINYFQQKTTFTSCFYCKEDIRIMKPNHLQLFEVQNDEIKFQNELFKAIHNGRFKPLFEGTFSISLLIKELDKMIKQCYTTSRSKYFQYAISKYFNVDFNYFMRPVNNELVDFSTLSVYERRICVNIIKLLLQNGQTSHEKFLEYFSKPETNEEIEQIMLATKDNSVIFK